MKKRETKPLLTRVNRHGKRRKFAERPTPDASRVRDPETALTPRMTKAVHDALDDWLHDRRGKDRKGPPLSQLRYRPAMAKVFDEEQYRLLQIADVTRERVMLELARIGFSDPRCAFNEDGTLLPIHEMNEDVCRAIQSVKVEQLYEGRGEDRENVGQTKEIRFWSKVQALDILSKCKPIGLQGHTEFNAQAIYQFVVIREDRPGGREIESETRFIPAGSNGDAHSAST